MLGGHGIGINIHACQLNLEMAIYELKQGSTQTNLPAVHSMFPRMQ